MTTWTKCLALFLLSGPALARSCEEPRWTVTLEDGSRLSGAPRIERLELVGTLVSHASLDPAHLLSLRLDANGETWTVRGAGGDLLVGALRDTALVLDTGLGRFALPFEHVRSVRAGDELEPDLHPGLLGTSEDGFAPEDVLVDFETDPAGRRLAVGEDLSSTYVPWGLAIETSVAGSHPAVDAYVVDSRSRGSSCATRSPRWEGTLTLRFCEPGRPERPATVTRVGLWVAAVAPNGTRLRALGVDGEVLGEVATTRNGSELLAVRSTRPIAAVQVVPDESIDPNYTIDDVMFDAPRPLGSASRPATCTVTFRTGDVLEAQGVELDGPDVVLIGLTIGVERLRVPRGRVASIRFPLTADPVAPVAPVDRTDRSAERTLAGAGGR